MSGKETPLLAIHDFLVNNRDYLVINAKTFERANLNCNTRIFHNRNPKLLNGLSDRYLSSLGDYLNQLGGETKFTSSLTDGNEGRSIAISLDGPIDQIYKIRKKLRTGLCGISLTLDEISYS